jgi:hypothetical protein
VGTSFLLAKRPCASQAYVGRIPDGVAATAVHVMRFGLSSEVKAAGVAVHRMGFGLSSELKAAGTAVHRMRFGLSSELEAAGAAVAVGEEPGQGGDRDLGGRPGADVEPDRPVHAGDLGRRDAEFGQHRDVRPGMMRVA